MAHTLQNLKHNTQSTSALPSSSPRKCCSRRIRAYSQSRRDLFLGIGFSTALIPYHAQPAAAQMTLNRVVTIQDPKLAELCPVKVPGVAELYVAQPSACPPETLGPHFPTIGAALEAAPSTAVSIRVFPGRYTERLVINKPNVSIVADTMSQQGETPVEVVWETNQPYQSVVDCSASNVRIRGLVFKHFSKSVANNYGIYIHGGSDLWLESCDISSSSGTGIGIEGAAPLISRCRIHECSNHGIAVFGPLDLERPLESVGGGTIKDCTIEDNKGDGIRVRSSAEPKVTGNTIRCNNGFGLLLRDCGGQFTNNSISKNSKGGIDAEGYTISNEAFMVTDNSIEGSVKVL